MLKALYDFKATFAKTLSFQESDMFILYQANTKQRNWWQVVNSNGQVGYVPSNYVTTIQVGGVSVLEPLHKNVGYNHLFKVCSMRIFKYRLCL